MQENLDRFFDSIARLSFWRRLFGWSAIRRLSYDAFRELGLLRESLTRQAEELSAGASRISLAESELDHAREQLRFFENERGEARAVTEQLRATIGTLSQEVALLRGREDQRETDLQLAVTTLHAVQDHIAAERGAERDAREAEARERIEKMRSTWRDHEQAVRDHIKLLCQRHTVDYVDVVPFHGSPDNTIRIAEEYVVFDAKSPANDDLRNFPAYLKAQAEAARKYAKEEKVKREIYFVVPTQTLSILQSFVYNFQDHTVYVVSVDALEPIILSLRRIQEYEFAEQLSPEERENIIRIIARFMHMTKRRIQVDAFFSRQFLDAISAAETDLQNDLLSEIHESERTLKLNPPQDQRAKLLTRDELKERQDHIDREIEARDMSGTPTLPADETTKPRP
ncbi:MAG TPA: hypothetical protein VMG09_03980 [Bacteroidota bacterium]|nr:hypothetical protein [Bacteroidota bacterium]